MNKNYKRYLIILGIILVVYNLLVFVIPFNHAVESVFWLSWLGGLIAIVSQGYTAYLAFNNKETLKSKFYGLPIIRVGLIYLTTQMMVSLLMFIIGAFVEIPVWIIILLDVILLGLAAIGVISSDVYREEIEKMEEKAPLTTEFIYGLRIDTKLLSEKYQSSPVYNLLNELADEVRYSDPISNEALEEIEDEINRKLIELKSILTSGNYESTRQVTQGLIELVKERNYRCKLSKK